jgi:TolB-like protein
VKKLILVNVLLIFCFSIFPDEQQHRETLEQYYQFNYDKRSRDLFSGINTGKVSKKGTKKREKIVVIFLKPVNTTLELADAVSQNLALMITSQKILMVVDNIALSKRMNDYSPDFAIKQAKLSQAAFALVGTISQIGNNFALNLEIYNTDTQEVIMGINETAENESDLFNVIKKVAYNITKNDDIVKKYLKDLQKTVVFDFNPGDIDPIKVNQITETLIYDLPDYNKYWAVDKIERDKIIKEMNLKDINSIDSMIKIAKKLEAKYFITGKAYKNKDKFIIEASAIDTENGKEIFKKIFSTKYDYQLVYIAQRIPEIFSLQKDNRISDEILDVDIEKYENIKNLSHKSAIGLLASGLSLSLLGFSAVTSGSITLGMYFYNLNHGLLGQYERVYTVSTIVLLCIGSPVLVVGIILAAISSLYFEREKQYRRFIEREKKVSFNPILENDNKAVYIGLRMKF